MMDEYVSILDQILNVAIIDNNNMSWILSVVYAPKGTDPKAAMGLS